MKILNFSKYKLLCATSKWLVFWHKNLIIVTYNNPSQTLLFKYKLINNPFLKLKIFSRLLRIEPRATIAVDDNNVIFSFRGASYIIKIVEQKVVVEHFFSKGMKNPLYYCLGENDDGTSAVLYGEYIWNENHGPVSIYRRTHEGKWTECYTFTANTITHIHNIIYDKIQKKYYISTGDEDGESGIWMSDLLFSKVTPIVIGSQNYRSCIGLYTNDEYIYATDTPLQKNYLYVLNNKNKELREVSKISGPVIFGRQFDGSFYFSTSVEPDSSASKWKYRLTNKLGKGVEDKFSHVYSYNSADGLVELCKFKKDFLPMWLFQFGNILFPYSTDGKLYITTQSLKTKKRTMIISED